MADNLWPDHASRLRALIDAFVARDLAAVYHLCAASCTWTHASLGGHDTYHGPDEIVQRLAADILREWEVGAVEVRALHVAGVHAVAFARWSARHRELGHVVRGQVVMVTRLDESGAIAEVWEIEHLDRAEA